MIVIPIMILGSKNNRALIIEVMQRNNVRTAFVLLLLTLAVVAPVIASGYSELKKAQAASSSFESAEHYRAAAARLPWRPDLYERAGHDYYSAKEYGLAEAAYRQAFKRKMLSPDGWWSWGDVVYLNGDTERAVDIWEQGLEQPVHSEKLYLRLAGICRQNREYSKAAQYLRRYVEISSGDASAHYHLGLLLMLSDPQEAFSELTYASQLDPQFDPVVQTLRTALNLASINDVPSERFVIIGRGLGLVNEWELALAAFEEAVNADGKNAEAWAWLGEADQHTGGNEALIQLDRALDLNPNSSIVRSLRGLYFQRTGNHNEALKEFQSVTRLEPENPALFVSLGDAYAMTGDLILGLQAYQYAATLAPGDVQYWLLLAAFCAENNVNLNDVGIPAAQKAVELSPKDAHTLDVLGWTYSLAGMYSEAQQMLQQALEQDPQYASAHFHLAVVYLQMDDRVSAFEHFIHARDLGSAEADAALRQYFP